MLRRCQVRTFDLRKSANQSYNDWNPIKKPSSVLLTRTKALPSADSTSGDRGYSVPYSHVSPHPSAWLGGVFIVRHEYQMRGFYVKV